ncbi:glycoside hydrolase family 25 protein [Parafilimonas sp.]|uniref:glycoside hydrolase family 25 protein n=1 Tax=Parafilimonas sp. TaxID=1969739 RepID=UPI003F80D68F
MAKGKRSKKKAGNKLFIIASVIVAALSLFIWVQYLIKHKKEAARFALYPGFGIQVPLGYTIHGIDVSNYQGNIHWPAVAQMQDQDISIKFAFIKATEGLSNVDRQFKRNWQKAKETNITRGAYHFFLATKSGRKQAQNFIKHVQLEPGDLPPVLDIEELYGVRPDSMRSRIRAWITDVEDAYNVKPVIYTSASFYKNFLGHEFDEYPLWVAHYFVKEQPGVAEGWYFWQHNATGKVNGIKTRVDFNVFSGDTTLFKSLLVP